jgi:hypothetical protein
VFHRHTIHIVWFPFFTQRFSRTVIATSRIPTSPINAQSPPAVHILLYNARIMPFRGSCTRIGVATLRASCAASHSHAGPHRARNEPSGGVNEIRNTTGLSSTIVEPHRHD